MIDCPSCGSEIELDADSLHGEDDEHTCPCGVTIVIGIDEDEAYVSSWRCVHGARGDEPCEPCKESTP